jgi:hypothetical protein
VVLGGGLIRAASPEVIERIESGINEMAPTATVVVVRTGPIVGAALLGLDEMTARPGAAERVRSELDDAFIGVEHAPAA